MTEFRCAVRFMKYQTAWDFVRVWIGDGHEPGDIQLHGAEVVCRDVDTQCRVATMANALGYTYLLRS